MTKFKGQKTQPHRCLFVVQSNVTDSTHTHLTRSPQRLLRTFFHPLHLILLLFTFITLALTLFTYYHHLIQKSIASRTPTKSILTCSTLGIPMCWPLRAVSMWMTCTSYAQILPQSVDLPAWNFLLGLGVGSLVRV